MSENQIRNDRADYEDHMRMEDVASESSIPCQECIHKQETIDRLSAELDEAIRNAEDLNYQLTHERQ